MVVVTERRGKLRMLPGVIVDSVPGAPYGAKTKVLRVTSAIQEGDAGPVLDAKGRIVGAVFGVDEGRVSGWRSPLPRSAAARPDARSRRSIPATDLRLDSGSTQGHSGWSGASCAAILNTMSESTTHIPETRLLQRSRSDRMLAGVSGGLARYFDIHPAVFRVGFVVLTLLGGAGILIYAVAALVMPDEGKKDSIATAALATGGTGPGR